MDPTVTAAPARPDSQAPRDLACRRVQGVASLYSTRSDLRGIHAFADLVEEFVRWSV